MKNEHQNCKEELTNLISLWEKNKHVFSQAQGDQGLEAEVVTEAVKKDSSKEKVKKIVDDIRKSPNPVRQASTGKDSENIGITFTPEDVNELADLRKDMYALENEANAALTEMDEKKFQSIQNKIKKIKDRIDKLANKMTRPHETGKEISSQGD